MYVDTLDCYKYGSLRSVYSRISKIESISLFLSLFKSYYFTLQLRPLLRVTRHTKDTIRRVITYDGS